jgi:hypothetical protein
MPNFEMIDDTPRKLAAAIKAKIGIAETIMFAPQGRGWAKVRETLANDLKSANLDIRRLSEQLELSDKLDEIWPLAKAAVEADVALNLGIGLASPAVNRRASEFLEARKAGDLFDVKGVLCHFDRESSTTWK